MAARRGGRLGRLFARADLLEVEQRLHHRIGDLDHGDVGLEALPSLYLRHGFARVVHVAGDAGWAGFTNTWFFVDPKNEIAAVAMSQLVGTDAGAPVLVTLRTGVYEALGIKEAFDLNK